MTEPGDYLVDPLPAHQPVEAPTMLSQRSVLTIFLVAGLLLATAIGVLLYVSLTLVGGQSRLDRNRANSAKANEAATLTNRQTGFKNRSVACASLAIQVGRKALPPVCLEPDVLAYYNPDRWPVAASSARQLLNTQLLCQILRRPPSCAALTP